MPLTSAFAPGGLLICSSRPYHAEVIYKAMRANVGEATNYAERGLQDAKLYAQAMAFGRVKYTLERTANQIDPAKATELLPELEADYRISPRPTATLGERRGELATRLRLPQGGNYANMSQALADLLGDDFVQLRVPTTSEASVYPTLPGLGPGIFGLPSMPRALGRTATVLSTDLNGLTPQVMHYTDLDGSRPAPGDRVQVEMDLVIEPEHPDMAERVHVEAVTSGFSDSITAAFKKPHPAGVTFAAMPWPFWTSTKRHYLVQLSASAAQDAEKRRKVHDLMRRMTRGVSTWAICGNAGPFTIGSPTLGIIGATPLGSI